MLIRNNNRFDRSLLFLSNLDRSVTSSYLGKFIILISVSHISPVKIAFVTGVAHNHTLLIRFGQVVTATILTGGVSSFNWSYFSILIIVDNVKSHYFYFWLILTIRLGKEAVVVAVHFIFYIKPSSTELFSSLKNYNYIFINKLHYGWRL